LGGRAAIASLFRLRQELYGLPADSELLTARLVKEVAHELGHTFGLTHCPDWRCAMHASNTVEEVDLKGATYCRACAAEIRNGSESN